MSPLQERLGKFVKGLYPDCLRQVAGWSNPDEQVACSHRGRAVPAHPSHRCKAAGRDTSLCISRMTPRRSVYTGIHAYMHLLLKLIQKTQAWNAPVYIRALKGHVYMIRNGIWIKHLQPTMSRRRALVSGSWQAPAALSSSTRCSSEPRQEASRPPHPGCFEPRGFFHGFITHIRR